MHRGCVSRLHVDEHSIHHWFVLAERYHQGVAIVLQSHIDLAMSSSSQSNGTWSENSYDGEYLRHLARWVEETVEKYIRGPVVSDRWHL
jgi:hypothetical protein